MKNSSLLYGFIIGILAAFTITTIYCFVIFILRHRRLLAASGTSPDIDDIENQRITYQFHNLDKGEGVADGGGDRMCAVCLSDFEEGEVIRLLPHCRHCFHGRCIDMWCESQASCPVCRAKIVTMTEENQEKVKGESPAGNCREEGGGGGWTAAWFWWVATDDSVFWI